jgi:outer membrane protein assembly factor BamA
MRLVDRVFQLILYLLLFLPLKQDIKGQDSLSVINLTNDSADNLYQIGKITITGNQKTHEKIIFREITFKEGDNLNTKALQHEIERSRTNLLNLPLFNFVTVQINPNANFVVDINIMVEERWFLWPQLAIINNERNFNTWYEHRDFSKLDYRLAVKQYNVLGLNHILRLGLSYGYTREISLAYQNIAIDAKQMHLIGLSASYYLNKTVFFRTYNNKQESFTNPLEDNLTGKVIKFDYNFRPGIYSKHNLSIGVQQISVSDSLIKTNSEFLVDEQKDNLFVEIRYQYTYDKRDDRSYPLTGFWLNFLLVKTGLGLAKNPSVDLMSLKLYGKQYYKISNRLYGAHSLSIQKSFENFRPYFYRNNLGYYDLVRGFEYYVISGDDYYLLKNNLKFELLPKTISYLDFIPLKKFKKIHYAIYLNTFFDIGYAHDKNSEEIFGNTLSDKILYSGGFGLDIVSYYDKVIRLEYSMNSINEHGFFVHFIAPI